MWRWIGEQLARHHWIALTSWIALTELLKRRWIAVYWLRKVECKGLEALLMQQEKFAILHMQNFIKATKSGGCVKWTPYAADLDNVHRDGVGKWC